MEAAVHTSIITSFQIEMSAGDLADQYRRQYASEPTVYSNKLDQLLADTLEQLVQRELILHEFETAGYSLPDRVIDDVVQDAIRERFPDRATATKSLQARGITYERFRKQLRDQFIIQQMRSKNISDVTLISPHKIEVYYVEHTNDFKVEEQVKLRMIVLTNSPSGGSEQARRFANEILAQIKSGASFADMATTYSQGAQQKEGGEWGWVEKSVLRKELTDVAFALKPGETSGIIDTPEACYIMLVEDKRPTHVKPLNEVRGEIENTLLREERDRLLKQWVDRLKNKTFSAISETESGVG